MIRGGPAKAGGANGSFLSSGAHYQRADFVGKIKTLRDHK